MDFPTDQTTIAAPCGDYYSDIWSCKVSYKKGALSNTTEIRVKTVC